MSIENAETESVYAWGDTHPDDWKMPTGKWENPPKWVNVVKYGLPAALVTVVVMSLFGHPQQIQSAPKTVVITPTAPPVANPKQPTPDTYFTQAASIPEFLQSLRDNGIPIASEEQSVKEAKNVCQQLKDGMTYRQIAINVQADHRDWKWIQAGGFAGAASGLCPEYRAH